MNKIFTLKPREIYQYQSTFSKDLFKFGQNTDFFSFDGFLHQILSGLNLDISALLSSGRFAGAHKRVRY